jgi:hypothetical protein
MDTAPFFFDQILDCLILDSGVALQRAGIALDSEISGAIKCSAGIPLDSRIPPGSSRAHLIDLIVQSRDAVEALKAASWGCADAAEWVSQIDGVTRDEDAAQFCAELTAKFEAQNIRGADLLLMDESHLKDLQLESMTISSRCRIIEALAVLKGRDDIVSDMRADALVNQVLTLRGKLATLYDYGDLPVPVSHGTVKRACTASDLSVSAVR